MVVFNSICSWAARYLCVCAFSCLLPSLISHTLLRTDFIVLSRKTTNQELVSCIINRPPVEYFNIWRFFAGGWTGSRSPGRRLTACLVWTAVWDGGPWLQVFWGGRRKKSRERMWAVGWREMTVLWAHRESLMMFWWLLRVTTQEPPVKKGRVRTPTWSVKAAALFIRTSLMIPMWTRWVASDQAHYFSLPLTSLLSPFLLLFVYLRPPS